MKKIAATVLVALYGIALGADWISTHRYEQQYREVIDRPPMRGFPLGTDALGRDRFARLLTGSRVSLLLAPSASLLAVLLATLAGGSAALLGGFWRRLILGAADLSLSLPVLFLLLLARAFLPLNTTPVLSVAITFSILGVVGWAGPARVVSGGAAEILTGGFILAARARGVPSSRLLTSHLVPALRPLLAAQFFTLIPVFLLAEANLGMLGLGVTEPLPSWGGLLRELEPLAATSGASFLSAPWLLAPALVLAIAVAACSILASSWRSS